jgi:hypothetical protein
MPEQAPAPPAPGSGDALKVTAQIVHEYLSAIRFIIGDTARDPSFGSTHLLSYLSQDFIESAASIVFLAHSGALSVPKRELRFLIESSIKLCYVQQKNYSSPLENKLKQFDRELSSSSIAIKRDLALSMLSSDLQDEFGEELGRLYGKTSTYVHLSTQQIIERIAAVDSGRTIGYESAAEVEELNALIARGFAASLVLILHSVSEYVAGDWLVDSDGDPIDSYFLGSRFVAAMDGYFDYKSERKSRIEAIQMTRAERIHF